MSETFKQKVLKIVSKIPRGSVLTYKEVATRAGSHKAFRAVGNILHANHNPKIPCHRVIGSDGKMHGFNRGINTKIRLLKQEGLTF
ncbi:MAG: MGMT family protein [Patescibacteria group bacterium]